MHSFEITKTQDFSQDIKGGVPKQTPTLFTHVHLQQGAKLYREGEPLLSNLARWRGTPLRGLSLSLWRPFAHKCAHWNPFKSLFLSCLKKRRKHATCYLLVSFEAGGFKVCALRDFLHYDVIYHIWQMEEITIEQKVRQFVFGRLFLYCNNASWQ